MKKWSSIRIIVIAAGLGLLLVSCSRNQANDSGSAAGEQRTVPLSMQLALGTLKLEETDLAVTAEQAAGLLPLWKAAKTLSNADNVTAKELEGLFKQIQGSMSPEQVKAIQSLDVSGQNMAQLAQDLGIELLFGGPANLSSEQQATMEASRQSGQGAGGFPIEGGPGGGPGGAPPGGEGAPPEGGPPRSSGGRDQADSQEASGRFETTLYQAVIELLQNKIQ